MSNKTTDGHGGVPVPTPTEPDEPMAADRRTLVIAAVVMLVLVLVGVSSAALFTTSACERTDPDPVTAQAAGTDLEEVLTEAFGAGLAADVAPGVERIEAALGPITGVADVSGADGLTLGTAGVVATGPVATALGPGGDGVVSSVDIEGTLVGEGDTLYALAVGNELTGQVDAVRPLDGQLAGETCIDTATVGTPLAFHLDAGDGELGLLRIEEDGSEPELEVRDAVTGSRWTTPVEFPVAPAGVQGQRTSAAMGPELVVAGHRTSPDAEAPVLTAVERDDGSERWTVGRDDLGGSLAGDVVALIEVVAVGDEQVVVTLAPDPGPDDGSEATAATTGDDPVTIVGLSPDDGSVRWRESLAPGMAVEDATTADGVTVVAVAGDGRAELTVVGPEGPVDRVAIARAERARVATRVDGAVTTVTGSSLLADTDGPPIELPDELTGVDVVADGGAVTVLFGVRSVTDGAFAVTFGG